MSLENRTREWIHKPVFNGAPVSWATEYFQRRLKRFRDEHKEFDEFLNELGTLLKKEKHLAYQNLKTFINWDACCNWISPSKGLFDIFIKLYNLCLSPKQAFDYIKECHKLYLFMTKNEYYIWDNVEKYFKRNNFDGKRCKFINVDMRPKNDHPNSDYFYWFRISAPLVVVEDKNNDLDCFGPNIELVTRHEMVEDTLMLFQYHQNKPFLKNVFYTMIQKLEKDGVIKENKNTKYYSWTIHYYEMNLDLSEEEKNGIL